MDDKIDQAELSDLRDGYNKTQLKQAQLAVARAQFELYLAEVFSRYQVSTQTHSLCMGCGCFNLKRSQCKCALE